MLGLLPNVELTPQMLAIVLAFAIGSLLVGFVAWAVLGRPLEGAMDHWVTTRLDLQSPRWFRVSVIVSCGSALLVLIAFLFVMWTIGFA